VQKCEWLLSGDLMFTQSVTKILCGMSFCSVVAVEGEANYVAIIQ
jgi:hypothetical protein